MRGMIRCAVIAVPIGVVLWLLIAFMWFLSHQPEPESRCVTNMYGGGCDE